jgi:phenylalanyl-tRNA synthetase beta chain
LKFSYNWIREMVSGLEASPDELSRLITMKTAESEGVERACACMTSVTEATVMSVQPIEGSHNRKAVVYSERYGQRTVVCGAPNCRADMLTAYVPPGVMLDDKEIRKTVIAGVESDGMLASGAELGLNGETDGILELTTGALALCAPDAVIEIDNKSLTHRPDLWGHHGMAREVAAITNGKLIDPASLTLLPEGPSPVKVDIESFELSPRYSALVLENITVQPSPLWLQQRLEVIGLNPINNIVDVTNYVMSELSQPMHAFDADKLVGDTIYTRRARVGESIAALNGENYELDITNLVIADAGGPIAIAGVIGGNASAISGATTRIVLESANFNATSVRRTSTRLKLRTDASMRFEKSQDPHNTVRGLARALGLLQVVSPGVRVVGGVADACVTLTPPPPIELPLEWLYRKLGRTLETAEVTGILESLEFGVTETRPGVLSVTVPTWRATKDISLKDDLVEEVGRMIGYASITPTPPLVPANVPHPNAERAYFHKVREMAAAQGFTEVYNYSFISDEMASELGLDPEKHIRVANPIASDQSLMRSSLLPGIRRNIQDNSRHFSSFRLFEIGMEIHPRPDALPDEIPTFVAALYSKGNGEANLFELKRLGECLLPGLELRPASPRSFEHPARAAVVLWEGAEYGRLFEFHPSLIETGRAAILELNLGAMFRQRRTIQTYRPLRRYPASAFDLSIVAGLRELVGEMESRLKALAAADLVSIEFITKYAGPPLPEDRKSVSFRLTVGASDRTLSSEDVAAIRNRVIEGMRQAGYELRV